MQNLSKKQLITLQMASIPKNSLLLIVLFVSCVAEPNLKDDWSVIDQSGSYSEFFFSNETMQIYNEVAGFIFPREYSVSNDSLNTANYCYQMNWLTPDSLILLGNDSVILKLKRISSGYKLSEWNEEEFKESYIQSFYVRMKKYKPQSSGNENLRYFLPDKIPIVPPAD